MMASVALPIPKLTAEQYLELERKAEYKSEYYAGEMFAMAGGRGNHSIISARLIGTLFPRLEERGGTVYTSDMRVRTNADDGLYTYPDASVVCGEPLYATDQNDVLTNPKTILETLSPSTEANDRGFKFREYQRIESLREYVLVDQIEPRIETYLRGPNETWRYSSYKGIDATLQLESLEIEIPLAEIYRTIKFQALQPRSQ